MIRDTVISWNEKTPLMKITGIAIIGYVLMGLTAADAALAAVPYNWAHIASAALSSAIAVICGSTGAAHGVVSAQEDQYRERGSNGKDNST
jgi:hypothetical protein